MASTRERRSQRESRQRATPASHGSQPYAQQALTPSPRPIDCPAMVDTPHAGATRAFTSGLTPRVVVAVIAVVIITIAVAIIEGPSRHAAKPALATNSQHQGRLTCRATAPVDVWLLRVNGLDLVADRSDTTTWTAELSNSGTQLFIEANLADPLANGPLAVHVTWDSAEQHQSWTLWGEGSISETVVLEAHKNAAVKATAP